MKVEGQLSDLGYTVVPVEQGAELVVGRALVVVVDDRTAHGDEDHSGPLVTELLTEAGFVVDGVVAVEADEVEIRNALNTAVIGGVDLVVSVGGTGVTAVPVEPLDPVLAGLVAHVTAYEQLALDAAVHGGRDRVYRALLAHPLIGQHDVAARLTDLLLDANRDHLSWLS